MSELNTSQPNQRPSTGEALRELVRMLARQAASEAFLAAEHDDPAGEEAEGDTR